MSQSQTIQTGHSATAKALGVHRRQTMLAGLGALGALALPLRVLAQDALDKGLASAPIHLVAPFPPGGPVDTLARVLGDGLRDRYKQSSVVDNLPGGAGNIGMDKVKRSAPDGHTLLVVPAGNLTINPSLMPDFPFRIDQDFAPVSMLAKAPNVLVVNPKVAAHNGRELVALAQSKPGALSFASPGVGSGLHLAGELFKAQTDTDIVHVPYKGTTQALNDLIGGQVQMMFSNLATALPFIRSGQLRAIGITDSKRAAQAPEIPTLEEQGIQGVIVSSWYGLLAPGQTAVALCARLAQDAADILNKPATKALLEQQALSPWLLGPDAFRAHIRAETASWAKIIKARHITV